MASANFDRSLAQVLVHEGGYVNHPKDPGGATNKGVTQATYDQFRRRHGQIAQSVKLITSREVGTIYKVNYWDKVRGDETPPGIDFATFDYGVNSGPSRSIKDLQRALNVPADGVFGPKTMGAVLKANTREVIKKLCARRLSFVQSLKIWSTFGRGWARRIASVEATALSWVSTKAQLEADAKEASTKSASSTTVATGTAGTAVIDQTTGFSGLPVGYVILAVVLVAGALVIRAVVQGHRARALTQAAAEATL